MLLSATSALLEVAKEENPFGPEKVSRCARRCRYEQPARLIFVVMAGLVPAIPVGEAAAFPTEMAGTRPATT
jgi:hypothetical protein